MLKEAGLSKDDFRDSDAKNARQTLNESASSDGKNDSKITDFFSKPDEEGSGFYWDDEDDDSFLAAVDSLQD